MKSVLMVYPVRQYVDRADRGQPSNGIFLSTWDVAWSRMLGLPAGCFRERFRIINRLIDEYREQGDVVSWLFFSDSANRRTLVREDVSDVFQIQNHDRILAAGVTYNELMIDEVYPKETEVLEQLPGLSDLVVGGFHESDCVRRFAIAANARGIQASVDGLLTEKFFFEVLGSWQYDLDARMLATGHLDPTMHEDDPEKVQELLTPDRIYRHLQPLSKRYAYPRIAHS